MNKRFDIRKSVYTIIMYLSPLISVVLGNYFGKQETGLFLSNLVLSFIIVSMCIMYLRMENAWDIERIKHPVIFFAGIVFSFLLLGLRVKYMLGAFWLLAVPLSVFLVGQKVAVMLHLFMMAEYIVVIFPISKNVLQFSVYFILGFLLLILCRALDGKKTIPYFLVVLTMISIVLQLAVNQFDWTRIQKNLLSFIVEAGSVLLLGIVSLICYLFFGNVSLEEITEHNTEEAEEQNETDDRISHNDLVFLQSIIEPDFDLFVRLQQYSMPLLSHSMRISSLSEQAAVFIGGVQPLLAKAGGLYHEVGRIVDEEDYIEAGSQLAVQYRFPQRLIEVMRQHSTGFEKPASKEAAIVMLSDCILSTSDYLQENGKRDAISDERLVKSIFQNRIDKGNLDESGFTDEQIERLMEFYSRNAFTHNA